MRLNPDCVRDILLDVEEQSTFDKILSFPRDFSDGIREAYDLNTLLYHLKQCKDMGFLKASSWDLSRNLAVSDLSPLGHEFLANVREDTVWVKTKQKAKEIGAASLSALSQIAAAVISNLISGKFSNGQ